MVPAGFAGGAARVRRRPELRQERVSGGRRAAAVFTIGSAVAVAGVFAIGVGVGAARRRRLVDVLDVIELVGIELLDVVVVVGILILAVRKAAPALPRASPPPRP